MGTDTLLREPLLYAGWAENGKAGGRPCSRISSPSMRRFVWSIAAAFAALLAGPSLDARQASPRNANYTLIASLQPATRTIAGRGQLTWRNTSTTPASELRFHLYWNAWRDASSTWLREAARAGMRVGSVPESERGTIDLTALARVTAEGREDLLPGARFIAPDDGNENDRTVLSVPLGQPVPPGHVVEIDMAWTSQVPRTVARTGVLADYFFIAHWFPKVGVFDDTGWQARQFHFTTEFYADYGVYDVSLTVPAGWVVGATGREQARTEHPDGTTTHRYVQVDVHDFAWTASPDFRDVRRRVEPDTGPPIDLRLLLRPEHVAQVDRHVDAARRAFTAFNAWFGPYPHGHLTIVDPATIVNASAQGGDTSGVEYPTLIVAGTTWYAPWKVPAPEEVVIHEIGHQYWQGVVGTNEVDHAWMDEGIVTFATARAMSETYGGRFVGVGRYFDGLVSWTYADVPWSRDVDGNRLAAYRSAAGWDAPARPSWQYVPASANAVSYAKTALWLTSLERMFGWDAVRSALSAFFARGSFRHPAPDELFGILSSATGRDLRWFFDAVHRSAATFDYAVDGVAVRDAGAGAIESTVVLRRLRTGIFPVDVVTTFDDGWVVTERWDGREEWRRLTYERRAGVRTVEIDPARVLTLDLNYTNNSWTAEPRAAEAASHWAVRWVMWLETVLLTYAFFA